MSRKHQTLRDVFGGKYRIEAPPEGLDKPCKLFTGYCNDSGHGRVRFQGRLWLAHRLVWSMLMGDIRYQINHLCDRPNCLEITHLYDGTQEQNVHDRLDYGFSYAKKTLWFRCGCLKTPDNTVHNGYDSRGKPVVRCRRHNRRTQDE